MFPDGLFLLAHPVGVRSMLCSSFT